MDSESCMETKQPAVRGSGLFLAPVVAGGSGWRLCKGSGTLNE